MKNRVVVSLPSARLVYRLRARREAVSRFENWQQSIRARAAPLGRLRLVRLLNR